ncbi:MAG: hypothetical protein WAU01_00420 [Saprospiraceae bacterium]
MFYTCNQRLQGHYVSCHRQIGRAIGRHACTGRPNADYIFDYRANLDHLVLMILVLLMVASTDEIALKG